MNMLNYKRFSTGLVALCSVLLVAGVARTQEDLPEVLKALTGKFDSVLQAIQGLEQNDNQLIAEIDALKTEQEELRGGQQTLQQQMRSDEHKQVESNELREALAVTRQDLNRLTKQFSELREQVQQKPATDAEKTAAALDVTVAQLNAAQRLQVSLQQELESAQSKLNETQRYYDEVLVERDQLRTELDAQQVELQTRQTQLAELEQQLQQNQQQIAGLGDTVQTISIERDTLHAQLEVAKADLSQVNFMLHATVDERDQLQKRLLQQQVAAVIETQVGATAVQQVAVQTQQPMPKTPQPDSSATSVMSAVLNDRYVVQKGDSLSKIAALIYGNNRLWREIYQANRDAMRNPNALEPGMELVIPAL
jgi:chromosome segregation ATPase